jgi:hypothetical protein
LLFILFIVVALLDLSSFFDLLVVFFAVFLVITRLSIGWNIELTN